MTYTAVLLLTITIPSLLSLVIHMGILAYHDYKRLTVLYVSHENIKHDIKYINYERL